VGILIAGGAGYIGSHVVVALLKRKEEVVVVDDLSTGHKESVLGGKLYVGDLKDENFLDRVFSENEIDIVMHFAASSLVNESVENPLKYYENNVCGTLSLLKAMKKHSAKKIVFSSTAAVYGEPERIPIEEGDKIEPKNPYGETKLAIEKILKWFDNAYGVKYISLRYFNVAGAIETGEIGEDHSPETHLIPIVLQVALGKRDSVVIYGDDYPTKDGTPIRDYIHVMDLVDAHVLALAELRKEEKSEIYNLGNGEGFSVKEVIEVARKVTGHSIPAVFTERRKGDPAILVASSMKAMEKLGWEPKYPSLEKTIESAWIWHKNHPNGFRNK